MTSHILIVGFLDTVTIIIVLSADLNNYDSFVLTKHTRMRRVTFKRENVVMP